MTTRPDPEGTVKLLAAILNGRPPLAGAACAGRSQLFDPQHDGETAADADYRHRAAQAICASCPALAACRAWVDQLPPRQRPAGVIAGQITTPTKHAAKSA